jgi:hypothetical protein
MIPGVELTTDVKVNGVTYAMHMNVVGIDDVIERAKRAKLIEFLPGRTVATAIRESRELSEALAKQRGNPPFFCMVNHPNWLYYDVFAQDLIDNPEIRFFEVCNNGSEWPVPDELDGEWYMADVTWDDPDNEEEIGDAYVYLNITDQVMALDHTTDKTYAQITDDEYGLLECYINNYLLITEMHCFCGGFFSTTE